MIPILFEATETKFTSNGIGRLTDAVTCVVTEERNGQYELTMTYPTTGIHYGDLVEERLILAVPCDGATEQPFRIYSISRPLDDVVTIHAEHISYALKKMIVNPFTAGSAAEAMLKIEANILGESPYQFWTDKETVAEMNVTAPAVCRSLLGGAQGSVLDVYGGGDYEFDRFTVKLHTQRGMDQGVTIRYGKNMTGLQADTDYSNAYASLVPYWQNEDGTVVGDMVTSGHESDFARPMCAVMDFTNDFSEKPSKEQLNQAAKKYLESNTPWEITTNIDISFIPLWQTEEYANVAPLERVHLCDVVTVEYPEIGVTVKTKVQKTEYDVLSERYTALELGSASRASLADEITRNTVTKDEVKKQFNRNNAWLEDAIEHATELIRGGLGGHVVLNTDADGKPQEILIMDTEDINTAQKVWRWNMGGFGYSSTGYNGKYGTAITMDGQIVADWVKTGNLQAGLIKVGILSDKAGKSYWNMDSGEMNIVANNFSLSDGRTIDDVANSAADAAQAAAEATAAAELRDFVEKTFDPKLADVQKALDGQLMTYYLDGAPTTENAPANGWTTDDLEKAHEGDLYYDRKTGYTYRWTLDSGVYKWLRVKDTDVTNAMNAASKAQDTADDKRRVFLTQPSPPYDKGDLWYGGPSTDVKVCTTAKAAGGAYAAGDWTKQDRYIDKAAADSAANAAVDAQTQEDIFNRLTNHGAAKGIILTGGQLYVSATYINTGTMVAERIKGGTLTLGGNGNGNGVLKIVNASNAQIGKWDNAGIDAPAGKIGGWTLSANSLYSGTNSMTSTAAGTFIGQAGFRQYKDDTHYVNIQNGVITAQGANITGAVTATSGSFSGALTAKSGSIGGFHIASASNTGTSAQGGHRYTNSLYRHSGDGTYEYEVGLKGDASESNGGSNSTNLAFYIKRISKGGKWDGNSETTPFSVTHAGKLTATNADITGKITATSGTFKGELEAATGTFSGSLEAATGTFNGTVTTTSGGQTVSIGNGQMSITYNGDYIGVIGGIPLDGSSYQSGISFGLRPLGSFMTWASQTSSSEQFYTMKWTYSRNYIGGFKPDTLNAGCDIDMHGFKILNNGTTATSGTFKLVQINEVNEDGTIKSYTPNAKLQFKNGLLIDAAFS